MIRDFMVCCGPDEDASGILEERKAQEIKRLGAEGERREIVFDEETTAAIITGVPRSWDDPDATAIQTSGVDPTVAGSGGGTLEPEPGEQEGLPSRPSANLPPTYLRVVVSHDPPGRIEEAYYSVERGMLHVTDFDGNNSANRVLMADEDPVAITRALLRERASGFNRPLTYSPLGLA